MISSLKDIEQRNADLESTVFDLKMRLYYLTNKLKTNNIALDEQEAQQQEALGLDDRFSSRLREHDFRTMKLREENEALRRQSSEMETELVQLRSVVSSSAFQQRNAATTGTFSLTQIEENRRTERQAATALSAHDAAMIAQLQEEVRQLLVKRTEDEALVGDLAYRLDVQSSEMKGKEFALGDLRTRLQEAQQETSALRDQLRRQDLLLESKLFKFDPLSASSATDMPSDESPQKPSLLYKPQFEDDEVQEVSAVPDNCRRDPSVGCPVMSPDRLTD